MLVYDNYAHFRSSIIKLSNYFWKMEVYLADEDFKWDNAIECMADHE